MKKISDLKEGEQQRVLAELATPDPVDTSPVRVLYYGHSFINHYLKWLQRHQGHRNLGFDVNDVVMYYHGDGGACIDRLLQQDNLDHVERIAPEVVMVEAGTNDISSDLFGPQVLELKLETLIRELKDRRVRFVIINQVLYRGEAAFPKMTAKQRKLAMKLMQCKTVSFNDQCERKINAISNCMFKKHPGLWKDIEQCVNSKGTHLNDKGHLKLHNSLRSAVIRAKRRVRPAKYMRPQVDLLN